MSIPIIIEHLAENIQMRKKTGHRLYHLLLAHPQGDGSSREGYLALAHLVKAGYFSVILTTSPGRELEEALEESGYQPPHYQTLIIGRDAPERISDALEGVSEQICIIKLAATDIQQVQLAAAPVIPAALVNSLAHYLQQDIIVVGSIEQEQLLMNTLHPRRKNSMYYVLPHGASSTIGELISTSRGSEPLTRIPDPYGEFDFFFKTLASILVHNALFNVPAPRPQDTQAQLPGAITLPISWPPSARSSHTMDASKQSESNGAMLSPPGSIKPQGAALSITKKLRADVLLVTANDIETGAVLALCPQPVRPSAGKRSYHDLGLLHDTRVFLVQCPQQGSYRPGGSRDTVKEGIRDLSPRTIIMVGVAFGFKPGEQQLGDILIAQEIQDYDLERIGSTADHRRLSLPRGPRIPASIRLLSTFKTYQFHLPPDWEKRPKVLFGLILSGSKLVDNEEFRNALLGIAPEAIGGEMEGMGLYDAASEKHVDWILIKAICDWADGNKGRNKDENQQLAAENAARFVLHVIGQGEFSRPRRRTSR